MNVIVLLRSVFRSLGKALREDPQVRRLLESHPRLTSFIGGRLRRDQRFGLGLTIGLSVALVFLYFFANILEDLANNDPLIRADLRVSALVQTVRNPRLTKVMIFLTDMGRWQTILPARSRSSLSPRRRRRSKKGTSSCRWLAPAERRNEA